MPISESQLETWSHQGSTAQSAATYEAVRKVLADPRAPYASRNFDVFLQGSYANDTNIYSDSDVDIVICLTSIYYGDISSLSDEEKRVYNANTSAGNYSISQFRSEVLAWLKVNFGEGVKLGNKAIFIPGNGTRRDVDVLACAEHHRYTSYAIGNTMSFHRGICFWTTDGIYIVNFPKQHSANCTTKHQATSSWFKPIVRVTKNMRNRMISEGLIDDGLAPSYFLEGMLYNVPDNKFSSNFQNIVSNSLDWLASCDSSKLVCANELYYLLNEASPVTWRKAKFDAFIQAAGRYFHNG